MIRKQGGPLKPSRRVIRVAVLVALAGVLFACAAAPVQEMSDARQSIEAARDAGADKWATEQLREAEGRLAAARLKLEVGDYEQARTLARSARELAVEARKVAVEGSR